MRFLSALAVPVVLSFGAAAQVDWRAAQSPVADQGLGRTCAAFALCDALETFPGVPADLSEQLLRTALALHERDIVAWMRRVEEEAELGPDDRMASYRTLFHWLGTCAEAVMPYDVDPKRVAEAVPAGLRRLAAADELGAAELNELRDGFGKYGFGTRAFELREGAAARDIDVLQQRLAGGAIAVACSYRIHLPSWRTIGAASSIDPGAMHRFVRGDAGAADYATVATACAAAEEDLVELVGDYEIELEPIGPDEDYAVHTVLLVGWDERGLLAKNSWGTGWGDGGYCRISWDYHRLYATETMVLGEARIREPANEAFETANRVKAGDFRVKVQKLLGGSQPQLVLSVWMADLRDAAYRSVEYAIEVQGEKGDWQEVVRGVADAGTDNARTGAPFFVGGVAGARLLAAPSVRIAVRIGGEAVNNARGEARTVWLRRVEFREFAPAELTTALDLLPR
ncbi:MAG: hypothetical protein KDE27_00180 [Planctomycetes bacterium]|nr:hypothetical protein [Planctomycetota bacterium]